VSTNPCDNPNGPCVCGSWHSARDPICACGFNPCRCRAAPTPEAPVSTCTLCSSPGHTACPEAQRLISMWRERCERVEAPVSAPGGEPWADQATRLLRTPSTAPTGERACGCGTAPDGRRWWCNTHVPVSPLTATPVTAPPLYCLDQMAARGLIPDGNPPPGHVEPQREYTLASPVAAPMGALEAMLATLNEPSALARLRAVTKGSHGCWGFTSCGSCIRVARAFLETVEDILRRHTPEGESEG